jgi:hypothetical protein
VSLVERVASHGEDRVFLGFAHRVRPLLPVDAAMFVGVEALSSVLESKLAAADLRLRCARNKRVCSRPADHRSVIHFHASTSPLLSARKNSHESTATINRKRDTFIGAHYTEVVRA